MAIKATFTPGAGLLSVTGDNAKNKITVSRDAAGNLLVDGGAVPIVGGQATVAFRAPLIADEVPGNVCIDWKTGDATQ